MTAIQTLDTLSNGLRVKCRLNGSGTTPQWFTGIITHINRSHAVVDILRDDRDPGGSGHSGTWTTTVTDKNCHLIKPLISDWDE